MKVVYIMRGIPGQGKSSVARIIADGSLEGKICSADDYHTHPVTGAYTWKQENAHTAHDWCRAEFGEALAAGFTTIIVDNTNTRKKEYVYYVEQAKKHGYLVIEVIVGGVTEEHVLHGIKMNKHSVPEATIRAMAARFEF